MYEITKEIGFDMGHRVPCHNSKCKNPHGHRYKAYITLTGDLIDIDGNSSEGMVIDFGDIKTIAKKFIDDNLDHGFMYYEKDLIMKSFFNDMKDFKSIAVPFIPTAENIAEWIFNNLSPLFKDVFKTNLKLKSIKLYETPTSFVIYEN